MRDRIDVGGPMPRFWPPRPSRVWRTLLTPFQWRFLWHHRIAWIRIEGMQRLARIPPQDGILICPNHSFAGDGSTVMHLSRKMRRTTCIMAAWHVFRGHLGLDGWLLQRQGLFSVDREGCDRRAIRTAIELLSGGAAVIIFPEGEIYHLNDRLTPLREGVAFIAVSAQKDVEKIRAAGHIWVVPAAIRYRFVGNVMGKIERTVDAFERRLLIRARSSTPIHERIINLGEVLLTIKEKEHLGRSLEMDGNLPTRIARLTEHLLSRLEQAHLGKTNPTETVPVRVKCLRRRLLESVAKDGVAPDVVPVVREALADVHLAIQLFSYPGDYLSTQPTPERMAETLEKFEEDMDGVEATPIGWRKARVILGEPIIVRPVLGESTRTIADDLTARLEIELQQLMNS